MEEKELVSELSTQGVTAVKQIYITKDGIKKKTNTMILTFNQTNLPKSIKAGYMNIRVQQFYPRPLRCFKCQHFGHHQTHCKHAALCARCGQAEHGENPCSGPLSCVNCKGNHSSFDKSCPKWIKETEVMKVKVNDNLSFPEARKVVEKRNNLPSAGLSYSTAAKSTSMKSSVETQTNSCTCQCQCQNRNNAIEVDQSKKPTTPRSSNKTNTNATTQNNVTSTGRKPKPNPKPPTNLNNLTDQLLNPNKLNNNLLSQNQKIRNPLLELLEPVLPLWNHQSRWIFSRQTQPQQTRFKSQHKIVLVLSLRNLWIPLSRQVQLA